MALFRKAAGHLARDLWFDLVRFGWIEPDWSDGVMGGRCKIQDAGCRIGDENGYFLTGGSPWFFVFGLTGFDSSSNPANFSQSASRNPKRDGLQFPPSLFCHHSLFPISKSRWY
jgi:hypothetical protein